MIVTNEYVEIITLMASISSMMDGDAIDAHMYPRVREVLTRVMSHPAVKFIEAQDPPNAVILTAILDRFDQIIPA